MGVGALVVGALVAKSLTPRVVPGPHPNRVVVTAFVNRPGFPRSTGWEDCRRLAHRRLQQTGLLEVVPSDAALQASQTIDRILAEHPGTESAPTLAGVTRAGQQVSGTYSIENDSLVLHIQVYDAIRGRVLGPIDPVKSSSATPRGGASRGSGSVSWDFWRPPSMND